MRTLLRGWLCNGDFTTISRGALLFEDDRIIAVEKEITGSAAAEKIIDFKDEIISPGFIDAHGHSDISAVADPECFSKISQGITTEITGNCGLSPFPVTPANAEHLAELYSNYRITPDWEDHAGYHRALAQRKVKLRIFSLTGHNTLRAAVTGYGQSSPGGRELDLMGNLLERELASGSPGLSTGLLYVPGCFSGEDELFMLMKILAGHNKVYATHLRSEGDALLESLQETLSTARRAGLHKVEISHLKTAGKDNFHKLEEVFSLIREYRNSGMDVRFDRYPYVESQTMLSIALGSKYGKYGDRELQTLLAIPEEYASALAHLRTLRDETYWQRLRLAGCSAGKFRKYQGMKFSDIPGNPEEIVLEILREDAPGATLAAANMSEENMLKILLSPQCCSGSDGNALPPDERFGRPHPRSFGAAAKTARLLLDNNLPVAEVCRKLSGAAAEFFALDRCGSLRCGNFADITVFSPEEIDSQADFKNPCTPARGIKLTVTAGNLNYF